MAFISAATPIIFRKFNKKMYNQYKMYTSKK